MKKLTKLLLLTGLVCAFSTAPAFATNWTIEVNGNKLDTEVKEINNRTLVPLRAVGEALNLDVNYDSSTGIVTLETTNDNFSSASIWLDKKENLYYAKVTASSDHYKQFDLNIRREERAHMNVAPVDINDRLYVPVRIVCDSFGAPVELNGSTISIGSCFTAEGKSTDKLSEVAEPLAATQIRILELCKSCLYYEQRGIEIFKDAVELAPNVNYIVSKKSSVVSYYQIAKEKLEEAKKLCDIDPIFA